MAYRIETLERCFHRPPRVSFEFFPPRNDAMEQTLWRSVDTLQPYAPRFVSVTYGAGGSTRERTHDTVCRLIRETSLTPAAHLTCVGASKREVLEIAGRYRDAGIAHIVALRGDMPEGGAFAPHPEGFRNAAELVAGLREVADFEISVAAHPETHPDARSAEHDIDNLRRKLDAGASRAITQYFFDVETFLRFRDRAAAAGVEAPIVPGILPVTNFEQVVNFSQRCGASVPAWMTRLFADLDDDPATRQLVAAGVAVELCHALHAEGVEEFHFYTLNRAQLTVAICRMLGIRPAVKATGASIGTEVAASA